MFNLTRRHDDGDDDDVNNTMTMFFTVTADPKKGPGLKRKGEEEEAVVVEEEVVGVVSRPHTYKDTAVSCPRRPAVTRKGQPGRRRAPGETPVPCRLQQEVRPPGIQVVLGAPEGP